MISYKDLTIVAELAGEALMTESDAQENDCVDDRNKSFDAIQRVWDEVFNKRGEETVEGITKGQLREALDKVEKQALQQVEDYIDELAPDDEQFVECVIRDIVISVWQTLKDGHSILDELTIVDGS